MRTSVVVPPDPVVTLDEAKAHLRVDWVDEDEYIKALVAAATSLVEGPAGCLGRALGVQTLEVSAWGFDRCSRVFPLPCPPLIEVESVIYVDTAGADQTLDPSDYEYGLYGWRMIGSTDWPSASHAPGAVRVRYTAGYNGEAVDDGGTGDMPVALKFAILLMVGDLYQNRETVLAGQVNAIPMSTTVDRLLSPFRIIEV